MKSSCGEPVVEKLVRVNVPVTAKGPTHEEISKIVLDQGN